MAAISRRPKSSGSGFLPKTKPTVDAATKALLEAVAKAAGELQIDWMVTGAAARVMLLESIYGLPHGRATQDVDLGVMVANWEQYQALVFRIRQDERFRPDPKQQQRLLYDDEGMLDLVPFGGIESGDRMIHWPPDNDFVMNVIGFREAYAECVAVELDGLTVPVVSPVGLMLLKLVAWNERHHAQPKKDAADLAYVLRHYATILSEKALFDEYFAAMEAAEFDPDLAASRVLGQKLAGMVAKDTRDYVLSLLDSELRQETDSRLVREVAEHLGGAGAERAYDLLQSLKTGFIEIVQQ